MEKRRYLMGRWSRAVAWPCLAFILALGQGCQRPEKKGTVLAQVGNATLTLEELRESFPAEFEQLIRREQYLDFIKRWIDDEVVYQQAARNKLGDDPQVKRRLAKLGRKLLIEEFLARENSSEVFEPDEMTMNQHYEMHKEEFRRKVPEIKVAHLRVETRRQAQDIRHKISGDNFLALSAAHSLDATPESYASLAFKKPTEIAPCLAEDVTAAREGTVTPPISCPEGEYLVKVVERHEAGSLIPFAEAKEEISGTLIMEHKDRLLERKISKFKENIAVSFNIDQIPGLTETDKVMDPLRPASVSEAAASASETPASGMPVEPGVAEAAEMPTVNRRAPATPKPKPVITKRKSPEAVPSPASASGAAGSVSGTPASPSPSLSAPASATGAPASTAGAPASAPRRDTTAPAAASTGQKPDSQEKKNDQKPE